VDLPPAGSVLGRLLAGGPHLTVGMLTADLGHLGDDLAVIERAGAELVHVDAGDGAFSPMFTFGAPVVKAMRTPMLKDVHLLVDDPLAKVDAFVAAGADMITFHVEGARQPHRVLQVLGTAVNANDPRRGVIRGIAVNPSTPIASVEPLLDEADYLLVLAINPGWGGQAFLPSTARRVAEARRLIEASGRPIALGIDGGVTRDNVAAVAALGADVVVSGSAIFDGSPAVAANAESMLATIRAAGRTPVPA
jgi:ribulose-phosphate 3-epimerase